jgi:hypothetical protein
MMWFKNCNGYKVSKISKHIIQRGVEVQFRRVIVFNAKVNFPDLCSLKSH